MDTLDTVLTESYNAAFVGLRNTRQFTIKNEDEPEVFNALCKMNIRNVSYEGEDFTRLVCFTTGIQTDRPFDKMQV